MIVKIHILSLFPEYFRGPLDETIIGRAIAKGILDVTLVDIRDFAEDKHKRVDDTTYGGGPGMVMMAEPVAKAIESCRTEESQVIYLSPQGTPLQARCCRELSSASHLILLCGHYEGIDQRVLDAYVDREISIGDYVLTNGCLAALVVVDAVGRLVPGVVGDQDSTHFESFEEGVFDHPHYTRPESWRGESVPEVLLSGHHKKIENWRREQAVKKTRSVRPDLEKHIILQEKIR